MNTADIAEQPVYAPASAWVLTWLFVAEQLLLLGLRGLKDSGGFGVVISMLVSALLIGWVAHGVLRARTLRLAFVWILLSFTAASHVALLGVSIFATDAVRLTGEDFVLIAFTVAQLAVLGVFCTTDYFKRCRTNPASTLTADLTPLVTIAAIAGLLGGLMPPPTDSPASFHFNIRL